MKNVNMSCILTPQEAKDHRLCHSLGPSPVSTSAADVYEKGSFPGRGSFQQTKASSLRN